MLWSSELEVQGIANRLRFWSAKQIWNRNERISYEKSNVKK